MLKYKFYTYFLSILLLFTVSSCAWENLPAGEGEEQRIIQVTMRCAGDLNPNFFYYIVFNLAGLDSTRPQAIFDGQNRGQYWHVYYMWGTPPFEETGIYRGLGGTNADGINRVDFFPLDADFLPELLPGTSVDGNSFTLRIDLTDFNLPSDRINMNMIVCSQAIDAVSKFEYEFDPFVFDSFFDGGLTIDLNSNADFWNENFNPQEELPNENEDIAPPEANINSWVFRIVT